MHRGSFILIRGTINLYFYSVFFHVNVFLWHFSENNVDLKKKEKGGGGFRWELNHMMSDILAKEINVKRAGGDTKIRKWC